MLSRRSIAALRASVASRAYLGSNILCCCTSCRPHRPAPPPSSLQRACQQCGLHSSHVLAYSTRLKPRLKARSTTATARSGLPSASRSDATTSKSSPPKNIAVLGGGLTGLTTAYYITRFHPTAKITIYEATSRTGGWIDTDYEPVTKTDGRDARVAFERGARAVSPQHGRGKWEDFVLFDLIDQLDLNKLIGGKRTPVFKVPKADPILSNRFIYYPDHLVRLPGPTASDSLSSKLFQFARTLLSVFTEPIWTGLWTALWSHQRKTEKLRTATYPIPGEVPKRFEIADLPDMSTGHFLEKYLESPELVNNTASALYHGVWGGDIHNLSAVNTTFQQIYFRLQHQLSGVIVKDHDFQSGRDIIARNPNVVDVWKELGKDVEYLGFHHGFSALTDALTNALKKNRNVTFKTGTPVNEIAYDRAQNKTIVSSLKSGSLSYDKVISSLFSRRLAELTRGALPELEKTEAVNILIVNLWYPKAELNHPHRGFGYLIPKSVSLDKNPHGALGVIFDSDRDLAAGDPEASQVGGTKLTVMLGGHYWKDLPAHFWPDADEAARMARETVELQMGISHEETVHVASKACIECIPQHLVNHRSTMGTAHMQLYNAFGGTLAVVGGSYTAPGVLGSLKAARDIALQVSGQGYKGVGSKDRNVHSTMDHVGETGLARFFGKNEAFRFLHQDDVPFYRTERKDFDLPI